MIQPKICYAEIRLYFCHVELLRSNSIQRDRFGFICIQTPFQLIRIETKSIFELVWKQIFYKFQFISYQDRKYLFLK